MNDFESWVGETRQNRWLDEEAERVTQDFAEERTAVKRKKTRPTGIECKETNCYFADFCMGVGTQDTAQQNQDFAEYKREVSPVIHNLFNP